MKKMVLASSLLAAVAPLYADSSETLIKLGDQSFAQLVSFKVSPMKAEVSSGARMTLVHLLAAQKISTPDQATAYQKVQALFDAANDPLTQQDIAGLFISGKSFTKQWGENNPVDCWLAAKDFDEVPYGGPLFNKVFKLMTADAYLPGIKADDRWATIFSKPEFGPAAIKFQKRGQVDYEVRKSGRFLVMKTTYPNAIDYSYFFEKN